jgi:hypothetical protein
VLEGGGHGLPPDLVGMPTRQEGAPLAAIIQCFNSRAGHRGLGGKKRQNGEHPQLGHGAADRSSRAERAPATYRRRWAKLGAVRRIAGEEDDAEGVTELYNGICSYPAGGGVPRVLRWQARVWRVLALFPSRKYRQQGSRAAGQQGSRGTGRKADEHAAAVAVAAAAAAAGRRRISQGAAGRRAGGACGLLLIVL